jgi:hypothetical protein
VRTIAWDIDDVLNDLMGAWLEIGWKAKARDCRLVRAQITENPPHRLLGASEEEYLRSLDEFRVTEHFQALPPRPEILAWFERHGGEFHHIALSAVSLHCAYQSASWVMRHFGRWIRGFQVVPSARPGQAGPSYDANKEAFLKRVKGIDFLLDDNTGHVEGAVRSGVQGILFPAPWNRSPHSVAQALELLNAR